MLRSFFALIFILATHTAIACPVVHNSDSPDSKDLKVSQYLCEVLIKTFPRLKNVKIKLKQSHNPEYYLASNFNLSRIRGKKHGYVIHYNPDILNKKIPDKALKAILAHELVHTNDYYNSNIFNLIGIGMKFLARKSTYRYERKTDLVTILMGLESGQDYLSGLKEYRQWIYQQINEDHLETKIERYYSPAEFDLLSKATNKLPLEQKLKFYRALIKKAPLKGELKSRIKEILLLI